MTETPRTMDEVNDRIADLGQPTSQVIDTLDIHAGDPWGTAYSVGEVWYVVLGQNTVKLTW